MFAVAGVTEYCPSFFDDEEAAHAHMAAVRSVVRDCYEDFIYDYHHPADEEGGEGVEEWGGEEGGAEEGVEEWGDGGAPAGGAIDEDDW